MAKIAVFGLSAQPPACAGCPFERPQSGQVETIRHDAAQEHVEQKRHPHLLVHCVGAVGHEVA